MLPKRDLIHPSLMQQFDVTLFFKRFLFYMTAEVSVLLIPAVPVCQSIESPQCIFSLALLPSITYPDTLKVRRNPNTINLHFNEFINQSV